MDATVDAAATSDLPMTGGAISFGDANCGAQPAPRTLAFHNTGAAPLTWSATIEGDGFAITSGASGTAMPGEGRAIAIAADPVPATATVGQPITATLRIATNASTAPIEFALSVTPHGGSLHVGTADVAFGQAQLTELVTQDLDISNLGDRVIHVALGAPADPAFTATWDGAPAAAQLDAQAALSGAVARFQPATVGMQTDSVPIIATGPVCAGDLPAVSVSGEGTTAQVTVTPATLQFGTTQCGSTAPPKQVTIRNAFHFAIHYTAQITAGPYAIAAGQATGSVAASGSTTITVNASSVPAAPASLGARALAGAMTVSTDAPGVDPAQLVIAQGASGAVLVETPNPPATIAFGDVAAGTPVSRPYSVKNTGNVAAAVTVRVTGSGFTATTPGDGTVPANGADAAATVTETVAARGALTGTLALSTSTVLCQPAAPGALDLTATGRAAVAVIGSAPAMTSTCGIATPPTVNVSVQNTGDEPLTIPSATASNHFAVISTFPMTIAAGASASIAVRPPAAVAGTDTAGMIKTGTLSFTTNEIGNPTRNVSLSSTVTGAQLTVTPNSPATIAFGNVNIGTPVTRTYSVRNNGNVTAAVTVATTGSGFSATTPGGGTIPTGGAEHTGNVTETVVQHGALSGTLTVSSTTAQCNAALRAVDLTATGRTPTAVIGAAPAMPATCGAGRPAAMNVSIQNTGDGPLTIPSATANGGFTVTSSFPMTIAAGASGNIAVRAPAAVVGSVTAGVIRTGTLSFATNEIGSPTHNVSLSSTVTGAQLQLTPAPGATIGFGNVNAGTPVTRTYSLSNAGNVAATVTVATTGPGFSATTPGGGTIPTGGVAQTANVTETVAQHGALSGTLTVSSTTAQCNTALGAVNLTATGRTPTAVIGTVPDMSATCGAGTPSAVNVPIQNTGDGPLVINATATGGFVITSALPMTVAAGSSASLVLRPPEAVVGSDVGGSSRSGTLTITTNELSGASHAVPLSSTVFGANLRLLDATGAPTTSVTFNTTQRCPSPTRIVVQNTGNAPASVAIANTNFHLFQWSAFAPSPIIPGGSAVSHALGVFTDNDNGVCNGAVTVQYTATGAICTLMPLGLHASFNIAGSASCFCS